MSTSVLIMGPSGSGKSSSAETLNPKETFWIGMVNKDLPFPGWKKNYVPFNPKLNPKGNYVVSRDPEYILKCLNYIDLNRPDIKNIVLDDVQYMTSLDLIDKIDVKGFDKFIAIAANLVNLSEKTTNLRDDLMCFLFTHSEEIVVDGYRRTKAKTIGKMVDEKIVWEGLFTIVLNANVIIGKDKNRQYVFETQTDGTTTAKSPRGMFNDFTIPNDLKLIREAILKYQNQ